MAIGKYWLVFKVSWQETLEYQFNFYLSTFKYALMIIITGFVWVAVAAQTNSAGANPQAVLQYFWVVTLLYSLSNHHTDYIDYDILYGHITKYVLKPISAFGHYYSYQLATSSLETIAKLVVMPIVAWWLGWGFGFNWQQLAWFVLYMPIIFTFSFTQFAIMSGSSFWIEESNALRWTFTIIFRFLAGTLVPLYFFPLWWQNISWWLPWQHLAYTPIQTLLGQLSFGQAAQGWLILLGWTGVITLLRRWQWHQGLHHFEGIGI